MFVRARAAVLAILLAAAAVPAFDYSIGRADELMRAGRYEGFQLIVTGTAADPFRYRVLVPYLENLAVTAASSAMPRPVAFHRVDAVVNFALVALLLWAAWRYLSNWFGTNAALVGALLVAATIPISLRQHFYAPYSLLEPGLLLLGLDAIYRGRLGPAIAIALIATLNRETGMLVGVALLANAWSRRERLVPGVIVVIASALLVLVLRLWLGPAPTAIQVGDVAALNLSRDGLSTAAINVALFLGVSGWWLAAGGWRRTPEFVRSLWWLPVVYVPLYLVAAVWYEVRLLMPLYPVLLPAILAAIGNED
jgi:hypothetical protein